MVGVFSVKTCHLSRATATHTWFVNVSTPGVYPSNTPEQEECLTRVYTGVSLGYTKKESIKEKDLPRSGKTERERRNFLSLAHDNTGTSAPCRVNPPFFIASGCPVPLDVRPFFLGAFVCTLAHVSGCISFVVS